MSILSIRCINVIIFCYVCGRLCLQCFFTNKISFSSTPAIVPLRWLKHFNAIFTKLSNINPNFIIWLSTPPIQIGPRGSIRPTPGTTRYPATYPEPPNIGSWTTSHEIVNELIFFVRMNRSQVCLKGKRQTTLFITKICTIYTEKMAKKNLKEEKRNRVTTKHLKPQENGGTQWLVIQICYATANTYINIMFIFSMS